MAKAGPLARADLALGARAAELTRHRAVGRLAEAAEAADQPPLLAACLATMAAGVACGDPRLARAGRRMAAAFLLAMAAKTAGKRLFSRTRPRRLLERGEHTFEILGARGREWDSFPSGHTAGGVAIARALAREYPSLLVPGLALATAAGLLKVVKGDHFPSDIAAGFLVGLGAEAATDPMFGKDEI